MTQQRKTAKLSRWLTRFQAIGFGFLVLLLIELSCRFLGYGNNEIGNDPFVGFTALEPLFALNAHTDKYEIRKERTDYFRHDSFQHIKRSNTYRIFVFGGSTVQGRPYAHETAFPKWIQLNLEAAFPDKHFEVVNCGGVSYASYRLIPIMEECLAYDPDLIILCTGQNEFLEARTYGALKSLAKPFGGTAKVVRTLATYKMMDSVYTKIRGAEINRPKKPVMKMEVDALLDYRRGLQAYHRDTKWQWGVITHFTENIRRMHTMAKKADVPLMILNPPVNLKDTAPFKSEHHENVSSEQKEAIHEWMQLANEHFSKDLRKAMQYLEWAKDIDPDYADIHFVLGHGYLAQGQVKKAKSSFTKALVEDVCPLRMLPQMRQFIIDFCAKEKIPHLDVQTLLEENSETPILGSEMLVDHVHPSIQAHQIIAEATVELIFKFFLGYPMDESLASERKAIYKTHLETLDDLYYTHGQQRLENLLLWTKGETDGLPIEMHVPIDPR